MLYRVCANTSFATNGHAKFYAFSSIIEHVQGWLSNYRMLKCVEPPLQIFRSLHMVSLLRGLAQIRQTMHFASQLEPGYFTFLPWPAPPMITAWLLCQSVSSQDAGSCQQ